ncbi:nitrilase-related carbon-nitrogen hydrolase [Leisingera aquimarina]|uniref:nitrilase-related carbon-nitrogen hydrolase n=1 Tax=Leisingera aquimarina TaxID=476529 RepID=UPI000415F26B
MNDQTEHRDRTGTTGSLHVAVLQHDAALTGPGQRFKWLEQQARGLQGRSIDLILCPEAFMSGYNIGDRITKHAQAADGVFASRVRALAKETEIAIAYGYPERNGTARHGDLQFRDLHRCGWRHACQSSQVDPAAGL